MHTQRSASAKHLLTARVEKQRSASYHALLALVLACQGSSSEGPSASEAAKKTMATSSPAPMKAKTESLDAKELERVLRRPVRDVGHGVFRVVQPRDEVTVRVDGNPLSPPAGLTSWAAFHPSPEGAMVMSDTVVFEDEVDGVIDAAFAHGLEVTALHNHFFFDEPRAFFMHVGGSGRVTTVASGIQAMWAFIASVRSQKAQPARSFGSEPAVKGPLNVAALTQVVGHEPSSFEGGVKFSVPRQARMSGIEVGGGMGLASWAAIAGSERFAAMSGDLAMFADEVQPALRALRSRGVHIVALHNHMVGETPAMYFVHFWSTGPAKSLAEAFRKALDALTPPTPQ